MIDPSDKEAEALFIALDTLDQISRPDPDLPRKIGFNELYAYANDPDHSPASDLIAALSTNLDLRRDLKRLLDKQALAHLPRLAAASSGEVTEREGDGFTLRLKPSKAQEDQVYLLIQTQDRDDSPRLLFVEDEDATLHRLVIDDFLEGEAQILLNLQDGILKALRNVKSSVILR
jgi:hypothetical protein